jgi:hypothetical protein
MNHLIKIYLLLGRFDDALQFAKELVVAEGEDGQYDTTLIDLLRKAFERPNGLIASLDSQFQGR